MHEVLVNRFRGLSLPRISVVRLTDRPDMTLDVYRGRKTTTQPTIQYNLKACGRILMKSYANELGHMTKMAAMPIYGKNL